MLPSPRMEATATCQRWEVREDNVTTRPLLLYKAGCYGSRAAPQSLQLPDLVVFVAALLSRD